MLPLTPALVILAGCGPQLPVSTSTTALPEAEAAIEVEGGRLRVDGAPADSTREGPLLTEVHEALLQRAMALRGEGSFQGDLVLQLHPEAESRVLVDLVYTAAQAGFDAPWLAVEGRGGEVRGIALGAPRVTVQEAGRAATTVEAGSWANPRLGLDPRQGFLLQVHDRAVDPGGGLSLPCPSSPCQEWPLVELSRLARRVKLDHPRDRAVMVAPAAQVSVQELVHTLDAVRDDTLLALGTRESFPVVHLTSTLETP